MSDRVKGPSREQGDAPRTDLPPRREPYDEGYFGTGDEEEEVVREAEEVREEKVPEEEAEKRTPRGENP